MERVKRKRYLTTRKSPSNEEGNSKLAKDSRNFVVKRISLFQNEDSDCVPQQIGTSVNPRRSKRCNITRLGHLKDMTTHNAAIALHNQLPGSDCNKVDIYRRMKSTRHTPKRKRKVPKSTKNVPKRILTVNRKSKAALSKPACITHKVEYFYGPYESERCQKYGLQKDQEKWMTFANTSEQPWNPIVDCILSQEGDFYNKVIKFMKGDQKDASPSKKGSLMNLNLSKLKPYRRRFRRISRRQMDEKVWKPVREEAKQHDSNTNKTSSSIFKCDSNQNIVKPPPMKRLEPVREFAPNTLVENKENKDSIKEVSFETTLKTESFSCSSSAATVENFPVIKLIKPEETLREELFELSNNQTEKGDHHNDKLSQSSLSCDSLESIEKLVPLRVKSTSFNKKSLANDATSPKESKKKLKISGKRIQTDLDLVKKKISSPAEVKNKPKKHHKRKILKTFKVKKSMISAEIVPITLQGQTEKIAQEQEALNRKTINIISPRPSTRILDMIMMENTLSQKPITPHAQDVQPGMDTFTDAVVNKPNRKNSPHRRRFNSTAVPQRKTRNSYKMSTSLKKPPCQKNSLEDSTTELFKTKLSLKFQLSPKNILKPVKERMDTKGMSSYQKAVKRVQDSAGYFIDKFCSNDTGFGKREHTISKQCQEDSSYKRLLSLETSKQKDIGLSLISNNFKRNVTDVNRYKFQSSGLQNDLGLGSGKDIGSSLHQPSISTKVTDKASDRLKIYQDLKETIKKKLGLKKKQKKCMRNKKVSSVLSQRNHDSIIKGTKKKAHLNDGKQDFSRTFVISDDLSLDMINIPVLSRNEKSRPNQTSTTQNSPLFGTKSRIRPQNLICHPRINSPQPNHKPSPLLPKRNHKISTIIQNTKIYSRSPHKSQRRPFSPQNSFMKQHKCCKGSSPCPHHFV
ncbi:unnamed protein product [Moneuplotes crassus]|uniref:Uncharacterized protein n=1 Tax=Euplotes crassus TaxID=5936 RepID=A0AAD1UMF3_EUPCR|nr:unnamed protein product [Moneuplotes crassus]